MNNWFKELFIFLLFFKIYFLVYIWLCCVSEFHLHLLLLLWPHYLLFWCSFLVFVKVSHQRPRRIWTLAGRNPSPARGSGRRSGWSAAPAPRPHTAPPLDCSAATPGDGKQTHHRSSTVTGTHTTTDTHTHSHTHTQGAFDWLIYVLRSRDPVTFCKKGYPSCIVFGPACVTLSQSRIKSNLYWAFELIPYCDWPRGSYLPGTVSMATRWRGRVVRKSSAGKLPWGNRDVVMSPVWPGQVNVCVCGGGTFRHTAALVGL